ncbi:CarD family transcriptional regulator [Bacillus sp. FSL K6-3431]|uniref:CarD family transcriptional regulator n=1 Tax=Bacillus sp. FSL K6-3431 TaxID=2921500 RepID=UPI0030F82A49
MFHIGDKVFYPMHGAGVIEAIEEREIQGEMQKYCVFTIPASNMDVMIPMKNMVKTGIRQVVDRKTLQEILFDFHNEEPDCQLPWKERFKQNSDKMRTGDMTDGAEVVRDLLYRKKEKPLNASEKQMLNNARKVLISELCLIKGISEVQAADMLVITH